MPSHNRPYTPPQIPIVIKDRGPLYRGFVLGICAVALGFGIFYVGVLKNSGSVLGAAPVGDDEQTVMAIARAEQINQAARAYVDNSGLELAAETWRDAASEQERYELLSSFIAFSPESFLEYMPEECEIVLWDEIGEEAEDEKAGLVIAGMVREY